jgi:methyl-accepting chemotaxis protein
VAAKELMVTIQEFQNNRIGIVGGGKAGLSMLDLFCKSQIATVSFVVDVNNSAPAIQAAREKGIPTFSAIDQALSRPVDFILEVTGSQKVIGVIQTAIGGKSIQLTTHQMAYIILEVLEDNAKANRKEVIKDFEGIKDEITKSSDGIASLLDKINSTTREALNARIEAARAGEHGRGFAVVAQQMAVSTESVQRISKEIHQVNDSINTTSNDIELVLQKLH